MSVLSNTGIRAGASGAGGGDAYQIEKSLRFNKDDDASLSRTFTSAGDQEKFTVSFWFKNCDAGANNYKMFFCLDNSGASNFDLYGGYLGTTFYDADGSGWAVTASTSATHLLRDPSAWYHIVLSIDTTAGTTNADRQKIWVNGEQLTLTFTTYWDGLMTGDVRGWNTADEHFIGMRGSSYGGNWLAAEYHFIDGQALTPSDFGETNEATGQWVPKEYTGGSYGTNGFYLKFNGTDLGEDSSGNDNHWTVNNLTQSIGTGQPKMYKSTTLYTTKADIVANGTEVTGGDSVASNYLYIVTNGASGSDTKVFSSGWNLVGGIPRHWGYNTSTSSWDNLASYGSSEWDSPGIFWSSNSEAYKYFNEGTEFRILCDPDTSSGPAVFSSGTNTAPTLTTSVSEQSTNSIDVSTDTPTPFDDGGNGTGNYATLNPLDVDGSNGTFNMANGNLEMNTFATNYSTAVSTIAFDPSDSDGFYFEVLGTDNNYYSGPGIAEVGTMSGITSCAARNGNNKQAMIRADGYWYYNSGTAVASGNTTWEHTDVIGCAVKDNKIWISKNGSWIESGNPTTGANPNITWVPSNHNSNLVNFFVCAYTSSPTITVNFGARPFTHAAPSGFKCLCTQNLDDPLIDDPSKHFDVGLDAGADILTTALGLTDGADFVWIKDRDNTDDHILFNRINDSGMDGTPHLRSNEDDDEDDCGAYSAPTGNSVAWVWNAGTTNTSVSVGDFNSTAYDQSVKWSGNNDATTGTVRTETGSYYNSTYDALELFNGDLDVMVFAASTGQWIEWTPANGAGGGDGTAENYTFTDKVEVYTTSVQSQTFTFTDSDDNTTNTTITSTGWTTIKTGGGVLKSIKSQGASDYSYWTAIRIDGKWLIDSDVTLPNQEAVNVPSLASTYRANPSAGFSIVSYTGTGLRGTLAHGLNATPELILVKRRNDTSNWVLGHQALAAAEGLYLNTDATPTSASDFFDSHSNDSSSVFSIAYNDRTGKLDDTYVAYVWAPVEGYSKFGSYEGTRLGSPNGVFVYCGFKPAWILVKNTEEVEDWYMWDSKRDGYNPTWQYLEAHDTDAENSTTNDGTIDIVSNGFKVRVQYAPNQDKTYVFAAFAETPFKYSNAR